MTEQIMTEQIKVGQVHELLREYLRRRSDLGIGRGLFDLVLESPNPFDSKRKRLRKRWFVLLLLLAASGFGCFVYFNSFR